ncbi:MAG: ribokinase [Candidatus Methylomirabilales bacterium]
MPEVVVVGSANIDLTVQVERLPRPGETVVGCDLRRSFGGKGANQAVAARRAGASVAFVGKVGSDPDGEAIRTRLAEGGIELSGLRVDEVLPTGIALITVERGGRNQIVVAPGSNGNLTVEDLAGLDMLMDDARVLLVQLEIPLATVAAALSRAHARRVRTILNPAPARGLDAAILDQVDILTPNALELETLSGQSLTDRAAIVREARRLLQGQHGAVIVTMGAEGASLILPAAVSQLRAFPVEAVDTTAAGDAFNGALAAGLAQGKPLAEAVRFASAAGALTTIRRGAQEAIPDRRAIEALLAGTGPERHGCV